jgi:hypothetical protein
MTWIIRLAQASPQLHTIGPGKEPSSVQHGKKEESLSVMPPDLTPTLILRATSGVTFCFFIVISSGSFCI